MHYSSQGTSEEFAKDNRQLREQLSESNRRLQESQQLTQIGSWSWDTISNQVEWSDNMFSVLGIVPHSVVPSYELALKYVHEDDKVEYEAALNRAVESKKKYYLENRITQDNGSVRSVISRGDFVLNSEGDMIRMFGTVQDVTDRWKLLDSHKQLEQFAHILALDFKSPLRTIISHITLLGKSIESKPTSQAERKYFSSIESVARDLYELINNVLIDSKLISSKSVFKLTSTKVLVKSIVQSLAKILEENNVSIFIGSLPKQVKVDQIKIRRVFQNLIENAVENYHPERESKIEIDCKEEESNYVFIVIDNGKSLQEKNEASIFNSNKENMNDKQDAGLAAGLFICKEIVELHGGKIWLEQSSDAGSEFRFSIPM